MGHGLAAVDVALHHAILIDADGGEHVECLPIAGVDAVEHQTDDNLLPGRPTLVPEFGLLEVDDVANVLHDAVQGAGRQDLVFVVVGDGDQQLRVTIVHGRAQIVAILEREIIGIARRRRVYLRYQLKFSTATTESTPHTSHMGKLLAAALELIAVFALDCIPNSAGHGIVDAEHRAL